MVTLQNDARTFQLVFTPAGPDRVQVQEFSRVGVTWKERETIVVSAERAYALKSFALQNNFSITSKP